MTTHALADLRLDVRYGLRQLRRSPGFTAVTVVGVAANVRTRGPDNTYQPELYVPYTQHPWLLSPRFLVVRTTADPLRVAVGAARGDVVRLVLVQGSRIALVGLVGGLAGALVLTRALASVLFEVSPTDPAAFALVTLVLVLVALLACYLPARRAARLDPISALRHE